MLRTCLRPHAGIGKVLAGGLQLAHPLGRDVDHLPSVAPLACENLQQADLAVERDTLALEHETSHRVADCVVTFAEAE